MKQHPIETTAVESATLPKAGCARREYVGVAGKENVGIDNTQHNHKHNLRESVTWVPKILVWRSSQTYLYVVLLKLGAAAVGTWSSNLRFQAAPTTTILGVPA